MSKRNIHDVYQQAFRLEEFAYSIRTLLTDCKRFLGKRSSLLIREMNSIVRTFRLISTERAIVRKFEFKNRLSDQCKPSECSTTFHFFGISTEKSTCSVFAIAKTDIIFASLYAWLFVMGMKHLGLTWIPEALDFAALFRIVHHPFAQIQGQHHTSHVVAHGV